MIKFTLTLCLSCLMLLATQFCCAADSGQKTYTFGVSETNTKNATKEQLEIGFSYLLKSMTEKVGANLKVVAFKNPDLVAKAIATGEIDGVFGSTVDMLKNEKLFNTNKLLSVEINNKFDQRYILLVRKDSNLQNIEQLKQTKFAYCMADSVGLLYLKTKLIEKKQGVPELFFSKILDKKDANLAINALFFKEVSAALVMESDFDIAAELNPQIKQQLVRIDTSPDYLVYTIGFSTRLNADDLEKMIYLASQISKDVKGNQFLKLFKASNLRRIDYDSLSSVKALLAKESMLEGKPK